MRYLWPVTIAMVFFAVPAGGGEPSRLPLPRDSKALLRNLFLTPDTPLLALVDPRDSGLMDAVAESAFGSLGKLSLAESTEIGAASITDAALIVAAVTGHGGWISDVLPELPVTLERHSFVYDGTAYRDADDSLFLVHPNPRNPALPLFLILGNSERVVRQILKKPPLGKGVVVSRDHRQVRVSTLIASDTDGKAWIPDPQTDWNFERNVSQRGTSVHFRFTVHGEHEDTKPITETVRHREDTVSRVRQFLGERSTRTSKINAFLYARLVDKGLHSGDVRLAHADFDRRSIHLALEHDLGERAIDPAALLILRESLGIAESQVLETGLATLLSPSWGGQGWRYWAARIHAAGMTPPLVELLDNELIDPLPYAIDLLSHSFQSRPRQEWHFPPRESPLLVQPMAASFIDWLLRSWGKDTVLQRYATWRPSAEEVAGLEAGWRSSLDRLSQDAGPSIEQGRKKFPREKRFQLGINFTFEGFEIQAGYLGASSDQALRRIRELGANSVAVIPYSYLYLMDRPSPIAFLRETHKENDASVIHAALEARRLGMGVLLKPHLQGGGWAGDRDMRSDKDWADFFVHYERWIRHYALLAQMYQLEGLCLGVELVHATLENPERWRDLAARIRALYSGQLTYAANWGREAEELQFWDALDVIGVDSYYPLSASANPSDDELAVGAEAITQRLGALSRRWSKPILFTEIGYPSHPGAWQEPWSDRSEVDLAAQTRATSAMLRALEGVTWSTGTYWWKWSSYGVKPRADASHLIDGKPAESALSSWYRQKAVNENAGGPE